MLTAALHDRLTSFIVSYLFLSRISALAFKSFERCLNPSEAVFKGVRNSWEM
jgi:hypothetical protein